ncbi:MAG TPA: hypothetical protein VLB02_01765 [Candidatus Paceibacterota bacterium]|nr:hypothetical protein [Candidatus Paceibacterota bacterium]
MHTQLKQVFKAFILVPFLATSMSITTFNTAVDTAVANQMQDKAALQAQADREQKAKKIDTYFAKFNLPIAGYGNAMVLAGEKYGIDPYLIAGLAMRESTGCKFIIPHTHNCFGWGGGKIKFDSFDEAIEVIAKNLGGHNEKTAHYYKGKNTLKILETYNPRSVVPTYPEEVIGIMSKIENTDITSA